MELERFSFDNKIVKAFMIATVLVGLTAAIHLVYPIFNFDNQYTTFGRIRPLHTNAIIFTDKNHLPCYQTSSIQA